MLSGFTDVDRTADPSSYARYVALANSQPNFQSIKSHLHHSLHPEPGHRILDVGCGLGFDCLALAKIVGPTGEVIGIDTSHTMIEEARKMSQMSGLSVAYHLEDVHRLHYVDNSFDSSFIASTLMHVKHPLDALFQVARVLRPGGRIAAFESDWETLVLSFDRPKLEKRIASTLRAAIRNPGVAHHLPNMFGKLGFTDVGVVAWTLRVFDFTVADQVWRIRETLTEALQTGRISESDFKDYFNRMSHGENFFGAITALGVVGTKLE
jgi:ubiquinone/menaquinone biosynthesis C-methylase UbiE